MRKYLLSLTLLLLSTIISRAQLISPLYSQIEGVSIGIEKGRSIFLEYGNRGFEGRLKHSLTFDRARYQYLRLEAGYTLKTKFLLFTCDLFYSTDWNIEKYNIGTQVAFCSNSFDKYGNIAFRYVPYYDSDLNFNQGWAVSGKLIVAKNISLVAEYGNTPDFRIAYKRLYLGAALMVKNLSVYPLLEIPFYENEIHLSHSQIVVSMSYTFNKISSK